MTVTDYFQPRSLPEALDLLGTHGPELLVMAGGTVAMPLINEGISLPRQVLGLRHAGLDRLERVGDELRIGATATLSSLAAQDDVPLLREAARRTASWAVRNMGTVGGNLFTPPPGGDVATALLALDARVVLAGRRGERSVPLAGFFTGFLTTELGPDELVAEVVVPLGAARTAFRKFGRKAANTPAVVTVATVATLDGGVVREVRIALGAAGPHPFRAVTAEQAIVGRALDDAAITAAADAAVEACDPLTDAVASAWYRRRMVRLFVRRALEDLARPASGREA